jgi:hypothetical protein
VPKVAVHDALRVGERRAFAFPSFFLQTMPAERGQRLQIKKWNGMATDYDAPRKTDEDTDSIQALQERVPDKLSGVVDVDDSDNPGF